MIIIRRSSKDDAESTSLSGGSPLTTTSDGSSLQSTQTDASSTATSIPSSSSATSTTSTVGGRSVTAVPTSADKLSSTPSARPAATSLPTSSNRSLSNAAIIAIIVGIVVCLIVSLVMAVIAYRLRRKNSKRPCFTAFFSRRLGQHKSESSESLTSFDTTTEGGHQSSGHKRGLSRPLVKVEAVADDLEKLASSRNLLIPKLPSVNYSTVSLPNYTKATTKPPQQLPVSHERGSSDPTDLYSQPARASLSDTALSRNLTRAETFSTLLPISTISSTAYSNPISASESASPYRLRLLSPILDSPSEPKKNVEFPMVSMSSTLSPARDSPHSLASLHTPSITPSPSRKSRKRRNTSTESPTISHSSFKSRTRQGISPISTKSTTSTAHYFESKPLPPSPPGPPAPPPPFPPPTTPLSQPPKKSVPLRGSTSKMVVKTPTSDGKPKPFQELYAHSNHSYQRSISEKSLKIQTQSKSIAHISSLVRPSFGDISLQPPKPVLKLDTSSSRKNSLMPSIPVASTSHTTPATATATTAVIPTPVSAAKSAPANLQRQHVYPFSQTPTSAVLSALSLPPSTRDSLRPLSNAATVASSRPPLTPSGPFELSNETEERRDSLEPLPLSFLSRLQSPLLSRSTTIRSSKLNTPSSASFLSIDPIEASGLPQLSLDRSPSISVPIVFRFRMSRGKSVKRSSRTAQVSAT